MEVKGSSSKRQNPLRGTETVFLPNMILAIVFLLSVAKGKIPFGGLKPTTSGGAEAVVAAMAAGSGSKRQNPLRGTETIEQVLDLLSVANHV